MSPRLYLRLLRPGWNLLWAAMMGFGVTRFPMLLRHTPVGLANWLSVAYAIPLFWGFVIANAAHAGMHRPFFLVLPDGLARVRRVTLRAVVVSAALFSAFATWWSRPKPSIADVGLIVAALTWPLMSRRDGRSLLLMTAPIFVIIVAANEIHAAVRHAPIACLLVCAVVTVVAWRLAFRPADVRERAWQPYNSSGPGFGAITHQAATRRFLQEAHQARVERGQTKPERKRPLPRFTGTTWSWAKMVSHAMGRFGFPVRQLAMAALFCAESVVLAGISIPVRHVGWAGFWQILAAYGQTTRSGPNDNTGFAGIGLSCVALGLLAIVLLPTSPRTVYPLPRQRIGKVVFALQCANIVVSAAAAALGLWIICLAGQIATGAWLPDLGITAQLAFATAALPLLPIVALLQTIRRNYVRLGLAVAAGLALALLAATRPWWIGWLLTPIGLATAGIAIAASFTLLHAVTVRYYRRCDLLDDMRMSNPLAAGMTC